MTHQRQAWNGEKLKGKVILRNTPGLLTALDDRESGVVGGVKMMIV